jgi:dGTPase
MKHLGVRERLEELEIQLLSPFAAKSRFSKGRLRPEEPSPVRTEFQRDRDRVIHCKAFRRLKHKTQVFLAPLGDHYMTRAYPRSAGDPSGPDHRPGPSFK